MIVLIMACVIVKTRDSGITLEMVTGVHWDRKTLFVYLHGGKFISLTGIAADQFWDVYTQGAIDLEQDGAIEKASGLVGSV